MPTAHKCHGVVMDVFMTEPSPRDPVQQNITCGTGSKERRRSEAFDLLREVVNQIDDFAHRLFF